jgi:hypothetical protein
MNGPSGRQACPAQRPQRRQAWRQVSRPVMTAILRRQPIRIAAGRPEGGYTSSFEVICFDCGDDPCRDYRKVSPELQRIRGPYPMEAGIAAYA